MSLAGVGFFNGLAAKAPEPVLETIRTRANQLNVMYDNKGNEGSQIASSYTRSVAREAYTITLNSAQVADGAFYARPR